LHVLSAPPAFVLSQDQTLREKGAAGWSAVEQNSGNPFYDELVLKGHPTPCTESVERAGDEVLSLSPWFQPRPEHARGLDVIHAVEFSKTSAEVVTA
jgi:hypothetical protein